ncbi:MAG: hypothetical protein V1875_01735 [Candidatus Altiarchaeota archaeon]
MRNAFIICLILLVAGCMKENGPAAVEIPAKVFFSEDFSGGLRNWVVDGAGGGAMEVVDHPNLGVAKALEMRSQMMRSVTAQAPDFPMVWDSDYVVSFYLLLQHRQNFGYTVYRDRNVDLELGEGTTLVCREGDRKTIVGRFDTNDWNKVVLKVRPREGDYDILFGKEFKRSCEIQKMPHAGSFSFGDPDPSDTVYGDGIWDEFKITDRLL